MKHYSVLKNEAIEALAIKEDGIYVDATLGYAGDSMEILKRLKRGMLFAFDKDQDAITYSKEVLNAISSHFQLIHSDYVNMKEELEKRNITKVDGILFDCGVSSVQIDENRGFSFMRDEQLDMRMDKSQTFSAKELINTYSYEALKDIFYKYAEEKKSSLIAKQIIHYREKEAILTTMQLVEIIKMSVGANYFYKNHPERKIFQAIRIEVNDELNHLQKALVDAIFLLKPKGRLVVITFHSLEDKIVKKIFRKYSEVDPLVKGLPNIPKDYLPKISIVNKKVIVPTKRELEENSRSRSSKMRVIERN